MNPTEIYYHKASKDNRIDEIEAEPYDRSLTTLNETPY